MSNSRILFVSSQPPVNGLFEDLLPFLLKKNINVAVLSCTKLSEDRINEKDYSKVTQIRGPSFKPQSKNLIIRVFNLLIFWFYAFVKITRRPKNEIVFFGSQPPFISTLGLIINKVTGRRFVCLVNDLYPNILKETGLLSGQNILYKALKLMMVKSLNAAEKVFVIGACMEERLIDEGVQKDRIQLIRNWTDEEFIKPMKRSENGLYGKYIDGEIVFEKNNFYVLYSGNIGLAHDFNLIVEAAKRLQHISKIKFIFVGQGKRKSQLIKQCKKLKLNNCTFLEPVPYKELSNFLSASHIHFISLQKKFCGLVVPSKFYSSLAVGRPVIFNGPSESEVARAIREHDLGLVVENNEIEKVVAFINQTINNQKDLRKEEVRIINVSKTLYSKRLGLDLYFSNISDLLSSKK